MGQVDPPHEGENTSCSHLPVWHIYSVGNDVNSALLPFPGDWMERRTDFGARE